jgi:cytochrome b
MQAEGDVQRVKVWDVPLRAFHWLVVLALGLCWYTAENHVMDWHRRGGYVVLAMVLFRLYWGFAGSSTARFSGFLRGPAAVRGYLGTLRGRVAAPSAGHNPLGGWSVLVMLVVLLAMPLLGLFAVDTDGVESGPLSWLVSFKLGRRAAHWHEDVFAILQALVVLHVAAILYYEFWKRQEMVAPMVTGFRRLSREAAAGIRLVATWRALPGLLVATAIVIVVALYSQAVARLL